MKITYRFTGNDGLYRLFHGVIRTHLVIRTICQTLRLARASQPPFFVTRKSVLKITVILKDGNELSGETRQDRLNIPS